MAAILRFKDKKYITQLLKAFADKKQVTIDITRSTLRISSLSPPFIYLTIPNSLYQINQDIAFTINAATLLSNIDLLDARTVILDNSFKLITALDIQETTNNITEDISSSFIDIPFITPIRDNYTEIANFSTKLLITKHALKSLLPGIVTYSNEDGLILRRFDGASEDLMKIDVEYLQQGYLNFRCSNNWVTTINTDDISAALFSFTDKLLCVRLRFKGHSDVHMEIHVPEMVDVI